MERHRPSPSDDASLVRQVMAGSHDALATLYDRYADGVFAVASLLTKDRQVAEEVVQETFLALWNRAELYDPATASLATWLHAIARNRTVDRLRAAGRRARLVPASIGWSEDIDDDAALEWIARTGSVVGGSAPAPGPESAAESASVRAVVQEALVRMPDAERTVIVMAYQEELTQSEIAERLGWPVGTVKTRTRRALARLREVLAPVLGDERRRVRAGERPRTNEGQVARHAGLGLARDDDGSR
jgi:RNA polymerase sigma-70 factor (ECF subfamily)